MIRMQDEFIKARKRDTLKVRAILVALILVFGLVFFLSYQTEYEKDAYVRFDMEIYDIIVENYWQEVNEAELAELFRLSLAQAMGGLKEVLPSTDRKGVAAMLSKAMKEISEEKKKALAMDTGIIMLNSLYPEGRSGLLSDKQETEFRDNVNNINRDQNLYSVLGVAEGAAGEKITQAYMDKKAVLEIDDSPEAKTELEQINYAYGVLSDSNTKTIYDETKIEPSVTSRKTSNNTLYLDLTRITPATFQEVIGKIENITESNKPAGIIIDLRGNIGGALDFARYFFALFVGPNQYAYDLFQKGELNVERTPAIERVETLQNILDVAILTDKNTQSTAELMAAVFKRSNRAKVVGTSTLGWGTVENTFPIKTTFDESERYSVLLVHSLTLRDDGEAIENKGIDPDVNTNESDWREQLSNVFKSEKFIKDVIDMVGEK